MEVFNKIISLLNSTSVRYFHKEHEPTFTSEDSARIRGDELSSGAKAILYKIQSEFCLFVFPGDRKMNTKKIKEYFKSKGILIKKSRFASYEELNLLTGLVPGSVPPFGKPILDFVLYVDPSLLINKKISFNAGSLTNSITISLDDYIKLARPEIFEFTI